MEATIETPIKYWKGWCPFRGLPHVALDHRCPTSVPSTVDVADLGIKTVDPTAEPKKRGRPKKDEVREPVEDNTQTMNLMAPHLKADSYCSKCCNEHIREKEMGRKFTERTQKVAAPEKKKRGRPRKFG